MERVEVWIENREEIRWWKVNKKGEIAIYSFPAQKYLRGRCEPTPKAVAEMIGIDEDVAAEGLSKLGEPVFIGDRLAPRRPPKLYLIIYPYQGRVRRKK